ncbi:TraK family protein [Cupriavidus taiwanensis]|uniref:TraK family protein n=1 Tax=Cupriavidus taiwanensis TaxID=164546 RepID=UPI002540E1D9|nr:TraK family protein [Cupriavidus taiwanensis]MDK3025129.1 TraK family protein [Cupriavidus taiwanensis]HEL7749695.1 TraK family protein [Stenotrophomonas maltophilia]
MAESSFPDELAAWIEKRAAKKRRQDAAAVAFLAVRGDVKAAMDSGYAVTTIYEYMREHGRVKCSYETFRKHVQRFIKSAPAPAPVPPPATDQAKGEKPAQQEGGTKARKPKAPEPKKPESAGIAGFNYNPKPNKEDLL